MYPWLWFWAPQFHFPFSGSAAQRVEPDTRWFFAGISPAAGNVLARFSEPTPLLMHQPAAKP